jgi:hypothetical protein
MLREMPSLDLDNRYKAVEVIAREEHAAYRLHDRDGFLEFATGMWLHTESTHGKPSALEVKLTLRDPLVRFPRARQEKVLDLMKRYGQLA